MPPATVAVTVETGRALLGLLAERGLVKDTPRGEGGLAWKRRLHTPFIVKAVKDGGSNGSASTTVSWTYTVKTLEGTTLATAKTPKKKRHPNVVYVDPSTTEYEGIAYYDASGVLQLFDANEIAAVEACV